MIELKFQNRLVSAAPHKLRDPVIYFVNGRNANLLQRREHAQVMTHDQLVSQ